MSISKLNRKLLTQIARLCEDSDVNIIGFTEQAETGVVQTNPLTMMQTGEYSFIVNFDRPLQVAAFKERKNG